VREAKDGSQKTEVRGQKGAAVGGWTVPRKQAIVPLERIAAAIHNVRFAVARCDHKVREKDLARKLADLENRYDAQFRVVFDAIRELMQPPIPLRKRIGFTPEAGA